MTITPSDRVVAALRKRGGAAPRHQILEDLTADLGRRDTGLALGMATKILARVETYVMPCGHVGLRLSDREVGS